MVGNNGRVTEKVPRNALNASKERASRRSTIPAFAHGALAGLSPTGLFTAMEVSPGNGREQRPRHGESSKERLEDASKERASRRSTIPAARTQFFSVGFLTDDSTPVERTSKVAVVFASQRHAIAANDGRHDSTARKTG